MDNDGQWRAIPERSRLASPAAICIGTAEVESLTSFLMRLAQAHAVPLRYLLSDEIYADAQNGLRLPWANWMVRASTVNGTGTEVNRVVEILERHTSRTDLRYLTLLPYKNIFAPRPHLLRLKRAWCGACLHDMRLAEEVVYEKLIWTIASVQICPTHELPLQDTCPHCSKEQPILSANAIPGFCHKCLKWLGDGRASKSPCSEKELWIACAIGEILQAAPSIDLDRLVANYKNAVLQSAKNRAGGSVRALSRMGVDYTRVLACFRDSKTVPMDLMLNGLFDLAIPISRLFDEYPDLSPEPRHCSQEIHRTAVPRYSVAVRKQYLQEELDSKHSRSPRDLAANLGYRGTAQLWRADRKLFKKLAESSDYTAPLKLSKEQRREMKDNARKHLENSVSGEANPSVYELAIEIGGLNEHTLRRWFPDLCRKIAAKRETQKNNQAETELRRALIERPVPSVSEVARRSRQSLAILAKRAPNLYRQLKAARTRNYAAEAEELYGRILPLLSQHPPLTGAEICRRVKTTWSALVKRLPLVAQQIKIRSRTYRSERSMLERMATFEEVKAAMQNLRNEQQIPTAARIANSLAHKTRDWTLLNDARKKAAQDFDAVDGTP